MAEYTLQDMLKRIKVLKKEKKINNNKLSEVTGISLGTLSKILAGVTKEPSIESIIKISRGLNVSADFLIFGENPSLTPQEQSVLSAYMAHPEMQPVINKILDIKAEDPSISNDIISELKQDVPIPTNSK